jgi:AraC-like DNA-binding protein
MSVRTLSRRFRAQVGITPAAFIARARIGVAQRLLETTTLSLEMIAERSGYGSATVFRERFAAIAGSVRSRIAEPFHRLRRTRRGKQQSPHPKRLANAQRLSPIAVGVGMTNELTILRPAYRTYIVLSPEDGRLDRGLKGLGREVARNTITAILKDRGITPVGTGL